MTPREQYQEQIVEDGYSEAHAKRMAMLAYPTKREQSLLKAHAARKANAAQRRQASQDALKTGEGERSD